MSYTSVISEAWKLFKGGKKFLFFELAFSGTYLVVVYVLLFLQSVFTSGASSKGIDGDYAAAGGIVVFSVMLCFALIGGFFTSILETGIYKGLAGKYLNDKLLGFSETMKLGFKPFFKLLIATILGSIPLFILSGLIVLVGLFAGVGSYASAGATSSNSSAAGIFVLVLCCSMIIIFPLFFAYSAFLTTVKNAILVDNMGISESLSYSFNFTKKHLGKFIALLLIAFLLAIVVSIPAYCLSSIGEVFQGAMSSNSRMGGINIVAELVYMFTQIIYAVFSLALGIYFSCYWIVSYVKLKKLGEPEVKPTEPVMAQA